MSDPAASIPEKIITPMKAAAEAVEERAANLRERAEGVYRRSKRKAGELEGELEDYVKEHPVRSVLVAAGVGAGVGLLLGVLLGRR
jgi:ElaB/YqjD/DUF883 family membrane-anchored ribosome-binding protein